MDFEDLEAADFHNIGLTPYEFLREVMKDNGNMVAKEVTALSIDKDPFYTGMPYQVTTGQWFMQMREDYGFSGPVHIRRMHYVVQASNEYLRSDGKVYVNDTNSENYMARAASVARHLGYIDPHLIVDHKNDPVVRHRHPRIELFDLETIQDPAFTFDVQPAMDVNKFLGVPDMGFPTIDVKGYDYKPDDQPFVLEIWSEKSTINDVLDPIAYRYGANLQIGEGFQSITNIILLLERLAEYDRPARILYVSDFDPAGENMPPAVARQLEFYLPKYAPGIEVLLDWVALTPDQVIEYQLPLSPVPDTDVRRGSWENRRDIDGRVELDALVALHPGELNRIIEERIVDWYDDDLKQNLADIEEEQTSRAADLWEAATRKGRWSFEHRWNKLAADTTKVFDRHREKLRKELAPLNERLEALTAEAEGLVSGFETDFPDRPEGKVDEVDTRDWLFDSGRYYAEQIGYYHRHRQEERPQRYCRECGDPFYGRSNKYCCSNDCTKAFQNRMGREQTASRNRKKACAYCGEMFKPTRSDHIYCKPNCKLRARRARKAAS